MAEALAVPAGIIAVIQLSGLITSACKSYIDSAQDYPKDLRVIYIETASIKVVFESLDFLDEHDPDDFKALQKLGGGDGAVTGCRRAMEELSRLVPHAPIQCSGKSNKKQRLGAAAATLAWPLKAERARKLLDEILQYKATISLALTGGLAQEIRTIKRSLADVNRTLTDTQKRQVCEWLQKTNPSPNHNIARRHYVPGTGDWVLRSQEWNDWINLRTRAVWMYGIPGSGKTVLAAHLIEEVLAMCQRPTDKKLACVYYYCYHARNQDETLPFLRWLLGQLYRMAETIPWHAYEPLNKGIEPDSPLLLSMLEEVLPTYDTVFVVVDALDESRPQENLLHVLGELVTDRRCRNVQLFATSRDYEEIKHAMSDISAPLSLSNPLVGADIRTYVTAAIDSSRAFRLWPNELRAEVQVRLSKGAKGMFRWAVCQLDILRRLHDIDSIRKAITSLPDTLDETYERTFSYILPGERELVRHTLRWICFHNSIWPTGFGLPPSRLVDAYRMCSEQRHDKAAPLVDEELLRESCGCLITYHSTDERWVNVTLAHYTVREFLESPRSIGSSSFFRLDPTDLFRDIQTAIFRHVQNLQHPDIARGLPRNTGKYSPCSARMMTFDRYCPNSTLRTLKLSTSLNPSLAFQLLRPSAACYPLLGSVSLIDMAIQDYGYHIRMNIEQVDWHSLTTTNPSVAPFIQLIQLEFFHVLPSYLNKYGTHELLRSQFSVELHGNRPFCFPAYPYGYHKNDRKWSFRGSVLEYCAVFIASDTAFYTRHPLEFVFRDTKGLVDFSRILAFYAGYHWRCPCPKGEPCVLGRVLELGAPVGPRAYQATLMQIFSYIGDAGAVRTLLDWGADPNRTGARDGTAWDDDSMIVNFEEIRALSPLRIVRTFSYESFEDRNPKLVEELLLKAGARDFDVQSE